MYLPQGFMTRGSYCLRLIGNRVKGATSAWIPTDISGVIAWWKADALAYSDGDSVAWTDSGPAGVYDVVEPTSYSLVAPTYQDDAGDLIGTKPVVRFDDSAAGDEQMLYDSVNCIAAGGQYNGSAFAVVKLNSSTATYTTILACNEADHADSNFIVLGTYNTGGANYVWLRSSSDAGYEQEHRGSTELVDDTAYILGWDSDDTIYRMRVSGAAQTLTKLGADDNAGLWFGDILNMDCTSIGGLILLNPTYFLNGDLAEIILYDHKLDSADVDKVESYLATKYGITLS